MNERKSLENMLALVGPPACRRRGKRTYVDDLLDELFVKPQGPSSKPDAVPAAAGVSLTQVVPLLRAAREEQSVSLGELQEETGMTRGRLSRIENGIESNLTIDTLDRIAQALGLRILVTVTEVGSAGVEAEPAERSESSGG